MKKILLIAATVAALLSGCTKPGPENKKDTKPVVSKLEVWVKTTTSEAMYNAFDIRFSGKDLSGNAFEYAVPVGTDVDKALFTVLNPEMILATDGKFYDFGSYELNLAGFVKPAYAPAASATFEFNYELGIRAYDKNNNLYEGSSWYKRDRLFGEGGEDVYNALKGEVERMTLSETRDAWLGKLLSGGWQVGADIAGK